MQSAISDNFAELLWVTQSSYKNVIITQDTANHVLYKDINTKAVSAIIISQKASNVSENEHFSRLSFFVYSIYLLKTNFWQAEIHTAASAHGALLSRQVS